MMSARFESPPKSSSSSLSDQYANVQVAMSANNQYAILPPGVKPSTNYASPIEASIPASNAQYAEFYDAKQLVEMNQLVTDAQSISDNHPPPPPL